MSRKISYHGWHITEGGWYVVERVFRDGRVVIMDESFDADYIERRCLELNKAMA